MLQRRLKFWKGVGRRTVSLAVMLGFLMANIGMPVSTRAPSEYAGSHSRSFPCQQHRCGCQTASQCWLSCCCFSKADRIAWANQYGAEEHSLPAGVEERVSSLGITTGGTEVQTNGCHHHVTDHAPVADGKRSCCERDRKKSSNQSKPTRNLKQPVASNVPQPHSKGEEPNAASEGSNLLLVPSVVARGCGGRAEFWLMVSEILPASERPTWGFGWSLVGYVEDLQTPWFGSAEAPPSPPPRA